MYVIEQLIKLGFIGVFFWFFGPAFVKIIFL